MSPSFSIHNIPDKFSGYTVIFRYYAMVLPGLFSALNYFVNLFGGQLRWTVRFTNGLTTFSDLIGHVFSSCAFKQMFRFYASGVVTFVKHAFSNVSKVKTPRDSMSKFNTSWIRQLHLTVPAIERRHPNPTLTQFWNMSHWTILVDLAPKAINIFFSHKAETLHFLTPSTQ